MWKFFRGFKDSYIKFSRIKDVLIMMTLFHTWPKQMYRFSTRNLLPRKENRFNKNSKPNIPYNLIKSKSSNIPMMKEINVVGPGKSFDLNNLKDFEKPTFLLPFWSPLFLDRDGNIKYKHVFSFDTAKFDTNFFLENKLGREFKKDNFVYVQSRKEVIEKFKMNNNKVISINLYSINKEGNYDPVNEMWPSPSYNNLFDHDQCKRISIAENIYKPPILPPQLPWTPIKSFLQNLYALSFFAEKINVYGWDFYLDSSPEKMGYWKLFFNMYKYDFDVNRGYDHFESALINYYYAYELSKNSKFKIYSYMGKLEKHENLIKKIEKVLFN
tara:strand:+ start:3056 stop:4036 length:981 start_codon:yes stop_codon:yes gene_type:complete